MQKIKYVLGVALLSLLVLSPSATAQSSKGILVGTVADQTGAVLAGATVKVTNTATGVSRETLTQGEGTYRLDAVDPGLYKVEVVAENFKTSVIDGVLVAAGQTTKRDFALEVGGKGEIVEVVDNSVILQTQDAARANTLDSRQIVDLPVASLNPVDLVFTLPGVVAPGLAGGFVQGTEFSINGLRARSNNQLIDGTDNNDNSITGQAYQPSLRDGYQEVSVLGGDNSAEYGRGGGAVVNLVTKSGTNQYHGSVYDVISPSALSALSSGEKLNQGLKSKPVTIQNQAGFSFGGPILKDKLFAFGTYQYSPFRAGGVVATALVPTADGFSLLRTLFPAGRSANLDRYLAVVGDLRGVTLPRPIALGGGRPNINFGVATRTSTQPVNDHQFLIRSDWAATTSDNFSFRYLFSDQIFTNQFPTAFRDFEVDVPSRVQNFLFSHTHTFSPTLTNEFRASYGRFNVFFGPRDDAAITFGPQIGVTGITGVGLAATFPQGRIFNNYQFQDTVTWIKGDHTIRAGADMVRQLAKQFVPINNRGTLAFTAGGGFPALGNFVDGFSGTSGAFGAKVFGDGVTFPNAFQQAYFITDTWRVKSNLTLSLGLRYENYGTPFNVVKFPAWPGFDVPFDTVTKQKRDDNNFAPRVAVAYTPRIWKRIFGEDKSVIRAGYAMSYDLFFNNILSNTAAASPNVFGANTFGSTVGGRGFANAGPSNLPTTGSANPLTGVTTINQNLFNPTTHVWNLGVQRETIGNFIVDVAYVGSRGIHLFQNIQANPGVNNARINRTRGPITLRDNTGDSIYHSLQTRVERGFKNGVFFRYVYTYSKAIDTVSEVFTTSGGSSFVSDNFNLKADRGPAAFDATHRNVFTYVWDIPGPKNGVWRQIAGGWTVSGTYRLQSGAVESPFVGGLDLNRDLNAFNDRAAISNPSAPANTVAIANRFFGLPGNGYVDANGDPINPANARYIVDDTVRTRVAGRNSFRGLRTNFTDFSVNKSFKMPWEGHKFEIRLEFFNFFNHPNFGVGIGDTLDPNFNNPFVNDGGNRSGRVQVRYAF